MTKYHSEKRNIGPLAPEWYKTMGRCVSPASGVDPVMCCYKKVTIQYPMLFLQ